MSILGSAHLDQFEQSMLEAALVDVDLQAQHRGIGVGRDLFDVDTLLHDEGSLFVIGGEGGAFVRDKHRKDARRFGRADVLRQ